MRWRCWSWITLPRRYLPWANNSFLIYGIMKIDAIQLATLVSVVIRWMSKSPSAAVSLICILPHIKSNTPGTIAFFPYTINERFMIMTNDQNCRSDIWWSRKIKMYSINTSSLDILLLSAFHCCTSTTKLPKGEIRFEKNISEVAVATSRPTYR